MKAGIRSLLSCCIGALVAAPAYGQNTVTVNAVGPGVATAGEMVSIDFMITADPEILLRGYVTTAPCALAPQDGATGTVDGPVIRVDVGRSDWAMCGAGCDCTCDGFVLLEFGACPSTDPRLGWAPIFASDSAVVGVGPAYLANITYTVSGDATGSFDLEFVDPETPKGGLVGCALRDPDAEPILANWIGTTVVIVECLVAGDCDDGEDCTIDTCDTENLCVHEYQAQGYADICLPYDPPDASQPDLDDILCVLDDFADGSGVDGCGCNGLRNTTDLHPCPEDGGGDRTLNLDDMLKMLDAFAGNPPCADPCPE